MPKNLNLKPDLRFGSGNFPNPEPDRRSGSFGVQNRFEPERFPTHLELNFTRFNTCIKGVGWMFEYLGIY